MKIIEGDLPGLKIITPEVFGDERGFFYEGHHCQRFLAHHLPNFVQDNFSRSSANVIRGLHYQTVQPQDKLVWVIRGKVLDIAVDIRRHSPTFGKHQAVILDDQNHKQFFIPKGFAHGFCVLSKTCDFVYKVSDYYHPESEITIQWNDPDLAIPWPDITPVLSVKDQQGVPFYELDENQLPMYEQQT